MEVEATIRDKIQVEVTTRGAIIRDRMATRYNKRHNVEIFKVGDIIIVGISSTLGILSIKRKLP